MSTVGNASDFLAKMCQYGDHLFWHKLGNFASNQTPTAPIAGLEASLFLYAGIPCEGVAPSGYFATCDNTLLGSMQQADPGGGRQKWLACFECLSKMNDSSTVGSAQLSLYDRLGAAGGLSGTVTNPQSVQGRTNAGTCTISNATPAVVTIASHGYGIGQKVRFSTNGTLPSPLTAGTDYYVISAGYTSGQFEVSTTFGGSAVNTTTNGSGTHTVTGQVTAIGRYTDGLGNEIWVEINTQIGASTTTITATYIDENGSEQTTPAVTIGNTNNREKTRIIRLGRAAGGKGVKQVISVTLAATTGTAGDFAVLIVHPIDENDATNTAIVGRRTYRMGQPDMPEIKTDAALCLTALYRSTTIGSFMGALHMLEA